MEGIHTICDYAKCIHVKTAVGFVKDCESRVEHGHLENLVAFLLSAGKAHVHFPLGKLRLHLHECHFFTHEFKKVSCLEGLESLSLTVGIHCRLHEISDGNSRNFNGILKRQEDACPCPLLR